MNTKTLTVVISFPVLSPFDQGYLEVIPQKYNFV